MKRLLTTTVLVVALGTCGLLVGCDDGSSGDPGDTVTDVGTIQAALSLSGARYDVTHIHFKVVDASDLCDVEPIDEAFVPLEHEALPPWMDLDGALADNHAFSDSLFVLDVGAYKVCAAPVNEFYEPSVQCVPVSDIFNVYPGKTTEGVLMSQCYGEPTGGLDVAVGLNVPPKIEDLVITDSKFTSTCELTGLHVVASDFNGDPMFHAWAVLDGPVGSTPEVDGYGPDAWFRTNLPGDYLLEVVVADPHGAYGQLLFPLHVQREELDFDLTFGTTTMPIGVVTGTDDVSTFYSYGTPAVYSANTGMELEDLALAFIYHDTDDDAYSLVLIHDTPGDDDGGHVELHISGLDTATSLVVSDDPNDSYDMATGTFVWNWAPCCTDGLAIEFVDRYLCTTVTTMAADGVDAWRIMWTAGDGFAYHDVPMGEPFTLCSCLGDTAFPPLP